jgi:hypothetical protein
MSDVAKSAFFALHTWSKRRLGQESSWLSMTWRMMEVGHLAGQLASLR